MPLMVAADMQGRYWNSSSRMAGCYALIVTPAAVAAAKARFADDPRVTIFLARFSSLAECADQLEPGLKFDGILFDLGVSSPQLDDAARGFSFMQDGPLDMRMSAGEGMSAADVVNTAPLGELIRIFREYGEERFAPRIARAIVEDRAEKPFERTLQLAEMIARVAKSKETKASCNARLPSAAYSRQWRTQGVGAGAEYRIGAFSATRTPGRDQLPFAGRPHGQTIHAAPFDRRSHVCRFPGDSGTCAAEARPGRKIHRGRRSRNRCQSPRAQRPPARGRKT